MSEDCLSGGDGFFVGGILCPYPKESSTLLSLDSHVDVYFPSHKRPRINAPLVASGVPKQQPPIEVLPDECLFEVFRRLDGQERSSCACVSKHWLFFLSSIKGDEMCVRKSPQLAEPEAKEKIEVANFNGPTTSVDEECLEADTNGYLSRCLGGEKATDVRLAAISIGTATRGGLGELSIRGNSSTRRLTNAGLKAISCGCPTLGALSLCNVPSVGDEGLMEIARGCRSLTKLNVCICPAVTDKGVIAVAMNCPDLMSVSIVSCSISNASLQSIGRYCRNLKYITIKNCPLVDDQGIVSLLSSAGHIITVADFQSLNISDVSLAVIGLYGCAMTDLVLGGLQNMNERDFWVMGKGKGLKQLKRLSISYCQGVTDVGLESMDNGFPELKLFSARKCPLVSDTGVISLAKAAGSLETLKLEECHRITQYGVFGVLANCGGKLKSLALKNCLGIHEFNSELPLASCCPSLETLAIRYCPGLGDNGLAMLGKMCPNLTNVLLTGLQGITDAGLMPLVKNTEAGLVCLNLSNCANLTDAVISEIVKLHGETLKMLILDGCRHVTDASLIAIARNCSVLRDLDVSQSQVSDLGINVLSRAKQLNLLMLSLTGCDLVSGKWLPSLGLLGKTLVCLNIEHCPRITYGAVNVLLENLWRCDIMY